jgi:hypothetical protein
MEQRAISAGAPVPGAHPVALDADVDSLGLSPTEKRRAPTGYWALTGGCALCNAPDRRTVRAEDDDLPCSAFVALTSPTRRDGAGFPGSRKGSIVEGLARR